MAIAPPDLFTYLDYRAFLRDWFAAKKSHNHRYSYRVFARQAGQRSPSLLHHVIKGKRNLTPANVEAFGTAMRLKSEERTFFTHLVALDQANDDDTRNRAWERIAATRGFREARAIEGVSVEYLTHWYYPAIRELAYRADFRDEPAWIADTLRPTISVPKARRALAALKAMGLLILDSGRVRPADGSLVTPHEVATLAVHNYHQGMLDRAREAISAFEPEERHLGGLTLAIPEDMVPRLKAEISAFEERILALCDAEVERTERVYQLNLQLFPLSASATAAEEP